MPKWLAALATCAFALALFAAPASSQEDHGPIDATTREYFPEKDKPADKTEEEAPPIYGGQPILSDPHAVHTDHHVVDDDTEEEPKVHYPVFGGLPVGGLSGSDSAKAAHHATSHPSHTFGGAPIAGGPNAEPVVADEHDEDDEHETDKRHTFGGAPIESGPTLATTGRNSTDVMTLGAAFLALGLMTLGIPKAAERSLRRRTDGQPAA